jgi:hypothetical protein
VDCANLLNLDLVLQLRQDVFPNDPAQQVVMVTLKAICVDDAVQDVSVVEAPFVQEVSSLKSHLRGWVEGTTVTVPYQGEPLFVSTLHQRG